MLLIEHFNVRTVLPKFLGVDCFKTRSSLKKFVSRISHFACYKIVSQIWWQPEWLGDWLHFWPRSVNFTFRKGSYQFQKGSLQNVKNCAKDFKTGVCKFQLRGYIHRFPKHCLHIVLPEKDKHKWAKSNFQMHFYGSYSKTWIKFKNCT